MVDSSMENHMVNGQSGAVPLQSVVVHLVAIGREVGIVIRSLHVMQTCSHHVTHTIEKYSSRAF